MSHEIIVIALNNENAFSNNCVPRNRKLGLALASHTLNDFGDFIPMDQSRFL